MAVNVQRSGNITVNGITYTLPAKFICAKAATGASDSEGNPQAAISLDKGTTYKVTGYATAADSGTTITHPYRIANENASSARGWFKAEIFPQGVYTLTIKPNGGSVWNGDNKTTSNFTTKFAYNTLTYIGNLTSSGGFFSNNTPTREGYDFTGWTASAGSAYQNTDGNKFYFNGGVVGSGSGSQTTTWVYDGNNLGNATITAQWSAKSYTVTFDPNGGTTSTSSKSVTYNSTYGTLPTPTRSGYSFNGWKDSNGNLITNTTTVTIVGNHTLTADWAELTLKIHYDFNGTPANELQINSSTYQLGDYNRVQLIGQTTSSSGATIETINRINGKHKVKNPSDFGVSRPGYTFKYYYITKNSQEYICYPGTEYSGSALVLPTSEYIYLTGKNASWSPKIYTITLDRQSGTGGPSEVFLKYDTDWYEDADATTDIDSITIPTYPGYYFNGYYTSTNGGGRQIINALGEFVLGNLTYTTSENNTLYAYWTRMDFTITYDLKGGISSTFPTTQTAFGGSCTLNSIYEGDPNYFPKSFWGWSTSSAATGISVQWLPEREIENLTEDKTLYAVLKDAIAINASGSRNQVARFAKQAYFYSLSPTRKTEYIFTSNSDLDPDIIIFDENQNEIAQDGKSGNFNLTCDLTPGTYYARILNWNSPYLTNGVAAASIPFNYTLNPYYIVTFNSNGASDTPPSIEVKQTANYENLPVISREGYNFLGWFTEASGGTQITTTTTVNLSNDITLYAHWDPIGLVQIWYDGEWKKAVPYVYNGTQWKRALTYINEDGMSSGWRLGTNYGQHKLIE